jgi:hypothetical protein
MNSRSQSDSTATHLQAVELQSNALPRCSIGTSGSLAFGSKNRPRLFIMNSPASANHAPLVASHSERHRPHIVRSVGICYLSFDWSRRMFRSRCEDSRGPSTANIAFAQSPPGIGRKRPSLPGQPPGDRASAVPLRLPQMRPVR